MKKALFFIILIVTISANAQTSVYHPFPDSGAVWGMMDKDWCINIPCYLGCTANYQFRVADDTLISGYTYKKIYKEGYNTQCYCNINVPYCSTSLFYSMFFGGIRNDTANRKVFFNDGVLPEELLYDFNLAVNDTLINRYCYSRIVAIDSSWVGGNYRKTYILENTGRVIEGIGNVNTDFGGPFEICEACVCTTGWGFTCFIENGNILFGDTNCSIITSVNDMDSEKKVSLVIFPNPTHDFIHIENNFSSPPLITVFSSYGTMVHRATIAKDVDLTIDLSSLANGIYLVTAVSDKNFVFKKIVKQ